MTFCMVLAFIIALLYLFKLCSNDIETYLVVSYQVQISVVLLLIKIEWSVRSL